MSRGRSSADAQRANCGAPERAGADRRRQPGEAYYIGYSASIVYIFRLGGGCFKYVSDYLAGDYASVGCYNTLTAN